MRSMAAIVKQAIKAWIDNKTGRLAGALAFYSVLSLAPVLIFVMAVVGAVFGPAQARAEILEQMRGLVGPDGAAVLRTVLDLADRPHSSRLASLLGLAASFAGATAVFYELQDGLNTIWRVHPKERGLLHIIKHRVISFAMVLVIGFLLMVSLVLSAAIAIAARYFARYMVVPPTLLEVVHFIVSFAIVTALFATIFKMLPDAVIAWTDVVAGAVISAFLFTTGKLLIALYLGNTTVSSAYGAAGSLVVLLLWVYYSAQILYLGAEFTEAFAERFGSGIRPKDFAESSERRKAA